MSVRDPKPGVTYYYNDHGVAKPWVYRRGCPQSEVLRAWGLLYRTEKEVSSISRRIIRNKKDGKH